MELINIKQYLKNECSQIPIEDASQHFLLFMENNQWFSIKPQVIELDDSVELFVTQHELKLFHEKFIFYLTNKDLGTDEKIDLLLIELNKLFPETSKKYKNYCISNSVDEIDMYYTLDFLTWYLKKDLVLYTNSEMDTMVEMICEDLSLKSGKVLIQFFKWLRKNAKTKYTKDFLLNSRQDDKTKQAYDCDLYLNLIYYLFNTEHIKDKNLYYQASQNKNTADTWLYLSLHCICSLRDSDLFRLPHPRLNEPPQDILHKISKGIFTDLEAKLIINNVLWQLKHLPLVPSKTSRYSNVSNIKLFIPESTQVHFGTLFALAECHYQLSGSSDKPLIRAVRDYQSISRYLGDELGELFLESDFSCRSADKTYMQIIELFADTSSSENNTSNAKGYMLAALARSHKGSFGSFAKTTVEYLKDANFSGYSAEFIAKELFERGVCSFIPSMLLKIVTDNKYQKLSISTQTLLIQELGLTPLSVDNLITQVDGSIDIAKGIVNDILSIASEDRMDTITNILQNIASGAAVSKQDECMCLLRAMHHKCVYIERDHCIGCKYEISTKATLNLLVNEFNRLLELRDKTDKLHLKAKYTYLLKDTIAPTIEEIIVCVKENYGESALKELELIIKESQHG